MTPERLAELAAKFPEVAKQFNPKGPIYEDALLRAEKESLAAVVQPEQPVVPEATAIVPVQEEPTTPAEPAPTVTATPAPVGDARFATPLAGALTLAAMGIPQIPVKRGEKKAFLKEWENLATTDAAQIKAWGKQFPNCNFGSVAKAEIGGFWFLELDENGLAKRIAGDTKQQLPTTLLVRSRPSRGHLYFKQNAASIAMGNITQPQVKGAGFSVRVHNEYVVCPGSFREDLNRSYEPVEVADIVEAPQWLIDWIEAQRIPKEKMAEVRRDENNKIPFGQIHDCLVQEAGRLAVRGYSLESRENALLDWSLDNCAVHDEEHVREVAQSTKNWKTGDPRPGLLFGGNVTQQAGTAPAELDDAISFETFADQEWELQEWLWHGRIPSGALTLYAGNPDTGKTTAALDLIARITRGMEFPNGEVNDFPPSDCILCEAEDSKKKTIGPKLAVAAEEAGADMARVTEMKFRVKGETQRKRNLQLSKDLSRIEAEIAKRPNVRLLVISPISAYLGPGIKAIDDGAVREILGQLQDMAERLDIAVVAVIHLNKSSDYDVIYRVSGAMGFVAVARASWLFALDKDPKSDKRYMMPIKGNLAEKQKSVIYKIALSEKTVPLRDRRNNCMVQKQMPRIYWGETAEVDANEMMQASCGIKAKDMLPDALMWMRDIFRDPKNPEANRVVSIDEYRKAERQVAHIPVHTMQRAKRALGITYDLKKRVYTIAGTDAATEPGAVITIGPGMEAAPQAKESQEEPS